MTAKEIGELFSLGLLTKEDIMKLSYKDSKEAIESFNQHSNKMFIIAKMLISDNIKIEELPIDGNRIERRECQIIINLAYSLSKEIRFKIEIK